ncbi:MAG: flagellar basal body rod protein FlgB [Bdellovibrionales bacterium]|nr:flagellar basal body rod protein FlgB [Bdellovibrionales bacterium]
MADIWNGIFDRSVRGLHTNLDIRAKRNEALISNVANAETPGYRAIDVNFAGELERAFDAQKTTLKMTSGKHMNLQESSGRSFLTNDYSGVTKPDGNNVDIDIQMAKIADNAGKYSGSANMIRKKLQMLREAIRFAQR